MSGPLGLGNLPHRGRQFAHPVDGPLAEFGKHVAEVVAQIDIQATAGFHNGSDGGNLRSGSRTSNVQPIFAAERQRAYRSFATVIVTLKLAVREIFFQSAPL